MQYKYSTKSQANLSECHPSLQNLFNEVIWHRDCSIVEGYRGQVEQDYAFRIGASNLSYPHSKHNQKPSLAVDVWPHPRPSWDDTTAWREFALYVQGVADGMGINVINGGLSWGWDYVHWQLKDISRG